MKTSGLLLFALGTASAFTGPALHAPVLRSTSAPTCTMSARPQSVSGAAAAALAASVLLASPMMPFTADAAVAPNPYAKVCPSVNPMTDYATYMLSFARPNNPYSL